MEHDQTRFFFLCAFFGKQQKIGVGKAGADVMVPCGLATSLNIISFISGSPLKEVFVRMTPKDRIPRGDDGEWP